jgi:hypothetical protein
VWHLGVAAQMLKQIELYSPPSIWSHSAYGLLSILINYFETIGRLLNPRDAMSTTMAVDFSCGFHDVYQDPTTTSGKEYEPEEFYRRARSGLFSLGSTQSGLWLHNDRNVSLRDFDIIQKNPHDPATLKYYINPHAVVRTVINHFPTFIARLNNPDTRFDTLRRRFRTFMGDISSG